MGLCLVSLSRPYNVAGFSAGVTVLSTDYKLLRRIGLEPVYRAIMTPNLAGRARDLYKRKQFIEQGSDRIELTFEGEGNFRAQVLQGTEYVYTGLRFRLYIEAPIRGNAIGKDVDTYHLRLGTVEVTDVSETTGDREGVVVFLSVRNWYIDSQDKRRDNLAQKAREHFSGENTGTTESAKETELESPFAKVEDRGQINEFSVDQWRAISRWVGEEFEN